MAKPELLMVATAVFVELHFTVVVKFCVDPSLYVPVAVKGNSTPTAIVGLAGVTAIETSAALLTVSVVDPLTDPNVAVIVVFPNPVLVAKPVLLIVATPVFVELQLTDAVRNCVLPSLYVPMAVSCCVSPSVLDKIVGLAGVSCSDTSVGDVTLLPSVVAMAAGSSPSETGERPRRDAVRLHLGWSRPNAAELRAHAVLGDDNPILNEMESDVEGLLVNRLGYSRGYSAAEYYLLPIDECYKLVGLIRMHWKGLSGGTEVWQELGGYFASLKARSVDVPVEIKEVSGVEEQSHA